MLVLFVFGFSASGAVGMCSLSLMESVPVALSATSLGVGDCITHLGNYMHTHAHTLLHFYVAHYVIVIQTKIHKRPINSITPYDNHTHASGFCCPIML